MEACKADPEPRADSQEWEKENFISNLPQDVRYRLLTRYLGPNGIANLEYTGNSMAEVCRDDAIWRKICSMEVKMKIKDLGTPYSHIFSKRGVLGTGSLELTSPIPFHTVYTQLIHPLRGLFGCALFSSSSIYGSILTLTYKNGAVYGEFWFPPADITDDMTSTPEFLLYIDEVTDKLNIQSEFSTGSLHESPFLNEWKTHGRDGILQLKDLDICVVREAVERIILSFHSPSCDFIQASRSRAGLSNSETHNYVYWNIQQSFPSVSDGVSQPALLPEGFFKGMYGPHGNELVLVQLIRKPDNSCKLTGLKVTGDPNVPAGKVTFEFDVSSNVNLTLEQQDDSIFLESLSNGEHFTQTAPQRQPFRLPNFLRFSDRIDSRVLEPLPQTCTSRMVGNGIIAQRGYQHPENVVVHLVTFTPSRFLLLWLGEINVAALFEKISDTDRFTTFC